MSITLTKTKALNDRLIAMDMLAGAITAAKGFTAASVAADNPDLKRLYKDFLQDSLMAVEELETYVQDQKWMDRFADPETQLKMALTRVDKYMRL